MGWYPLADQEGGEVIGEIVAIVKKEIVGLTICLEREAR